MKYELYNALSCHFIYSTCSNILPWFLEWEVMRHKLSFNISWKVYISYFDKHNLLILIILHLESQLQEPNTQILWAPISKYNQMQQWKSIGFRTTQNITFLQFYFRLNLKLHWILQWMILLQKIGAWVNQHVNCTTRRSKQQTSYK